MKIHEGITDTTPEQVNYNPQRLNRLDAFFQELIHKKRLQCASYLLALHGKIFAWKSMGPLSYLEGKGDLKPDSIRKLASASKAFTAVAIMQLIENGKLLLEQPVAEIIKEFDNPMYGRIQIFHLLTHTAGLRSDPEFYQEPYPFPFFIDECTPENWIEVILKGPRLTEIGKVWAYSSAGIAVLGEIIRKISGISYEDYIEQNILEPLAMERTFFTVPEELHNQICIAAKSDKEKLKPYKMAHIFNPLGGLYSSLHDMWKFGQMLLNKGTFNNEYILSRKSVEAMAKTQITTPSYYWGSRFEEYTMGLGLFTQINGILTPGTYNHEGAGFCALYMDPKENFLAAYFVPNPIGWVPEAVVGSRAIMWSGLK